MRRTENGDVVLWASLHSLVMVNQDVVERSEHLAHQLGGLDTRPYLKAPVAAENLHCQYRVASDPGLGGSGHYFGQRRRKAVVNITEGNREITRDFEVARVDRDFETLTEAQRVGVLRQFPVFVPNADLVGCSVLGRGRGPYGSARVRDTVRAPKSSVSLLMGFDEVRQFIAALPTRAWSVEQAHRLLDPVSACERFGRANGSSIR